MTDPTSTDELLSSIDSKLSALIALTAYGLMGSDSELPDPSYPSIDFLLSENGMGNPEIGKALGKSADAARMQVNRDRKKVD